MPVLSGNVWVVLFLGRNKVYPAFTAATLLFAITIGAAFCLTLPNVGQPQPLPNIPQEEKLTTANKAAKRNKLFFFMIKCCR